MGCNDERAARPLFCFEFEYEWPGTALHGHIIEVHATTEERAHVLAMQSVATVSKEIKLVLVNVTPTGMHRFTREVA